MYKIKNVQTLNDICMLPAKLNRTIRFKFGKALRKGTKVLIAETKENTCLVRIPSEPTIEYLVSKDALTKP